MVKITVEASNANEASEFLQKHFELSKIKYFIVFPNINAGADVLFHFEYSKREINVEVKKVFNIMKNSEGAPALRKIVEKAGFSESKLNEVFSITLLEKIGVYK